MKKLLYTTLIAFSLVLMACPYEGDAELCTYDEAQKFEKTFIGDWIAFSAEGSKDELRIEKGNKAVLFVEHKKYEQRKLSERSKLRAYATEVGGVVLYTIENENGKYNYCKFEVTSKNEFSIQFIDKDYMEKNFAPEEEVTTKVLKAFIAEHIKNEGFFTDKMEYYRQGSPEYNKVRVYMEKNGF